MLEPPRLTRVAPEIPVRDMDEAVAYYAAGLGFEPVMRMPDDAYVIVERDGVALHLYVTPSATPASMHVFVRGVDGLASELEARGARITQTVRLQPWGNRDFRVRDPFENEIKFTEPRAD